MHLSGARRTATYAVLIALSAVGAFIRLGPNSIAFDSTPGFVAALLLGPGAGALVTGMGHMAAAWVTGFPLTPFFHVLIMVAMAVVSAVGGVVAERWGKMPGAIALIGMNGLVTPALLSFVPNPLGTTLFFTLAPMLLLGAGINAIAAVLISEVLERTPFFKK